MGESTISSIPDHQSYADFTTTDLLQQHNYEAPAHTYTRRPKTGAADLACIVAITRREQTCDTLNDRQHDLRLKCKIIVLCAVQGAGKIYGRMSFQTNASNPTSPDVGPGKYVAQKKWQNNSQNAMSRVDPKEYSRLVRQYL